MSQPLQPLQPCVNRGKRRKRAVSSKKSISLLLVVVTLLQFSVVIVSSQESSSLTQSGTVRRPTIVFNRRRLEEEDEEEEREVILEKQTKRKKKKKSSSVSSSAEEDEEPRSEDNRPEVASDMEVTPTAAINTALEQNLGDTSAIKSFNVTAISMTTCVKIEYAVSYLTNLDWKAIDIGQQKQTSTWSDMYLLQLIILPASLNMVFFGSQLLLPVCTMTAAGLGVFCIFHFVDNYFKHGLDCPMKLALSGVSATLAAMGAAAFVRFGLFTLGTVSAGGLSYLFFDAFPDLDPGLNATTIDAMSKATDALQSDLSPHAWVITILLALAGGLFLRLYEQASLEVLTAILGGVGVSYSAHAFLLSRHVDLDRSVVFLIASAVALIGWRFQRNRRLRLAGFHSNPYHDYKGHLPVHAPPPPQSPMQQIASPIGTNPNLSLSNWNQLQYSLYSTNHLLQQQRKSGGGSGGNEMEAMAEELTNLLNSFQERIQERERSKRQ